MGAQDNAERGFARGLVASAGLERTVVLRLQRSFGASPAAGLKGGRPSLYSDDSFPFV